MPGWGGGGGGGSAEASAQQTGCVPGPIYLPRFCLCPLSPGAARGSLVAGWLPPAQVLRECMGHVVSTPTTLANARPLTQVSFGPIGAAPEACGSSSPVSVRLQSEKQDPGICYRVCPYAIVRVCSAVSGRLVFSDAGTYSSEGRWLGKEDRCSVENIKVRLNATCTSWNPCQVLYIC